MNKLIMFFKCLLNKAGKILGGVAVAVLSFYLISWIERSFQIEIIPFTHTRVSLSGIDEIYEIKFYLYNKGWSDRTLTGIEILEKKVPLNKDKSDHVAVNRLLEMKDRNYPVVLPKQSYTEITLDKLSSYFFSHSNSEVTLYFDKGTVKTEKKNLSNREIVFYGTINNTVYTGDTKHVLDSLTMLTHVDRILKFNNGQCTEDTDELILERESLKKSISLSKLYNKSPRYKKLDTNYFQFSAANLIMLDFFKSSKLGPIEISSIEFEELSPKLVRLYFIDKLIAGKQCKIQLTLYDKYYSQGLSAYTEKFQIKHDNELVEFSY